MIEFVKSLLPISKRLPVYLPIVNKGFEAAQINRLTSDWITDNTSINDVLKYSLSLLRARGRDLALNNDYAKRFLTLLKTNVVGHNGFVLQMKIKDNDGNYLSDINSKIENAFKKWSKKRFCCVDGRKTFKDALDAIIVSLARDGEVFVRHVEGYNNPFGYAIQFIEPDSIDENYNKELPNGNKIVMGIEVDKFNKAVAYYVKKDNFSYQRISADEIEHIFIPFRVNQVRGFTFFHTAMLRLKNLSSYEESELVASRISAAKMGFYVQTDTSDYVADAEVDGELISEVSPGVFEVLPRGFDFKAFDPSHPGQNYADFVKATLRGIASGLDISYFSLANDLEAVNYSSARIGLLEDREIYRSLQTFLINHFCEPVFERWLRMSILTKYLDLSLKDFEKYLVYKWQTRGFDWIDPKKDQEANVLAIQNGLKTRTQVAAEQGLDIEDVFQELASENKLAKKYQLNIHNAIEVAENEE